MILGRFQLLTLINVDDHIVLSLDLWDGWCDILQ